MTKYKLLIMNKKHKLLAMLAPLLKKRKMLMSRKRTHRFWIHDILKNRLQQGAFHNLVQELQLDRAKFKQYFRMSAETMNYILGYVGPIISKRATFREVVDAKQRLAICIR